jgi:hypothetical protein
MDKLRAGRRLGAHIDGVKEAPAYLETVIEEAGQPIEKRAV